MSSAISAPTSKHLHLFFTFIKLFTCRPDFTFAVHQHFTCIKQMFISIPHASSNHVHQANVHQHPTCIESHHDAPCSPANSKITERCTHPCSPSNDEIAPRRTHIHFTQSKATPPARKLSQHSCHLHGNQKPSARTDAPPPATNPNRGNVKNHQMRQTSTHVETTSITSDETTSADTGTCRIYARAEQEPKVEDNCLISIVENHGHRRPSHETMHRRRRRNHCNYLNPHFSLVLYCRHSVLAPLSQTDFDAVQGYLTGFEALSASLSKICSHALFEQVDLEWGAVTRSPIRRVHFILGFRFAFQVNLKPE